MKQILMIAIIFIAGVVCASSNPERLPKGLSQKVLERFDAAENKRKSTFENRSSENRSYSEILSSSSSSDEGVRRRLMQSHRQLLITARQLRKMPQEPIPDDIWQEFERHKNHFHAILAIIAQGPLNSKERKKLFFVASHLAYLQNIFFHQ